jgi:hypothetical protein
MMQRAAWQRKVEFRQAGGKKNTRQAHMDTSPSWVRVPRRGFTAGMTEIRNSISGRNKNTREAPAYRTIPLNVAHYACDTSQNTQKAPRLYDFSQLRCPDYRVLNVVDSYSAGCCQGMAIGTIGVVYA